MAVPQPKGEPVTVHSDEGPRADTLAREAGPTARRSSATAARVTAGNSSQLNDGAACVVLASPERARELGREPLARIVSIGRRRRGAELHGHRPDPGGAQGAGRAPAERRATSTSSSSTRPSPRRCWRALRELELDLDRLNVNGGAIALGHPLGASGARLLGTLIHEMRRRGAQRGLATMCIGVGQGLATVVEDH